MSVFKRGQKVRCVKNINPISGLRIGDVYTIGRKHHNAGVVNLEEHPECGWTASQFVLHAMENV